MADLAPGIVFPVLLPRLSFALETVNETHQTVAALDCLGSIVAPLLQKNAEYPTGASELLGFLEAALPGLDLNDSVKTQATSGFFASTFLSDGPVQVFCRGLYVGSFFLFMSSLFAFVLCL